MWEKSGLDRLILLSRIKEMIMRRKIMLLSRSGTRWERLLQVSSRKRAISAKHANYIRSRTTHRYKVWYFCGIIVSSIGIQLVKTLATWKHSRDYLFSFENRWCVSKDLCQVLYIISALYIFYIHRESLVSERKRFYFKRDTETISRKQIWNGRVS